MHKSHWRKLSWRTREIWTMWWKPCWSILLTNVHDLITVKLLQKTDLTAHGITKGQSYLLTFLEAGCFVQIVSFHRWGQQKLLKVSFECWVTSKNGSDPSHIYIEFTFELPCSAKHKTSEKWKGVARVTHGSGMKVSVLRLMLCSFEKCGSVSYLRCPVSRWEWIVFLVSFISVSSEASY